MNIFKSLTQAYKEMWQDFKVIWKPVFALQIFDAIISYITGWSFDTVFNWTLGIIVGVVMLLVLYTIVLQLWRKRHG
jgi:hypothetical protein